MTALTLALVSPISGVEAPSDLEGHLVSAAQKGEEAAFERLYRRHVAKIHTLACRMASAEAADDLTQDIFIRAWEKLPTFRSQSAFGTWLHRLAVNVILGKRRGERSRQKWLLDDNQADHPAREVHPAIRLDLERAMAMLPEGARQIFVLYDVEGWSHEEIAEQLHLAVGTSKSQLSRARATLRGLLDA